MLEFFAFALLDFVGFVCQVLLDLFEGLLAGEQLFLVVVADGFDGLLALGVEVFDGFDFLFEGLVQLNCLLLELLFAFFLVLLYFLQVFAPQVARCFRLGPQLLLHSLLVHLEPPDQLLELVDGSRVLLAFVSRHFSSHRKALPALLHVGLVRLQYLLAVLLGQLPTLLLLLVAFFRNFSQVLLVRLDSLRLLLCQFFLDRLPLGFRIGLVCLNFKLPLLFSPPHLLHPAVVLLLLLYYFLLQAHHFVCIVPVHLLPTCSLSRKPKRFVCVRSSRRKSQHCRTYQFFRLPRRLASRFCGRRGRQGLLRNLRKEGPRS